ncbi:MAG: DUF6064 family protein [Alphaproteobacteria bacterium]|nr:DUF6064 family protein [Alphaproteobacteria bacterium]
MSRMLPFTPEVFFSLFAQYNATIWPMQIVAYVLGLLAVFLTLRPRRDAGRLIAAILSGFWLWIGIVYHIMFFATINFAAPVFGVVFIVQGLLLAWTGVMKGQLEFRFRGDLSGWIGLGFAVFAMAAYPLLGLFAGHVWPRAPIFGVAPCPTTIFTLGLLLLSARRVPLSLLAIPVLWSLVGGSASWLLGVPEDIALPVAGIAGLGMAIWKNRRMPRAEAG